MFRRQAYDRINPRHVMPSRHTIFVRGLPGPTDVTRVKDLFSAETNSKCSVDFFSTSEDKTRLSIAIRFKSHEAAKAMLIKYNNKMFLGFPVEVTWFKDLKKARAKMYDDHRVGGGRPFNRTGFRGNFQGNDRRGMPASPNNNYYDDNKRMRNGSSSSGENANAGRPRYSNSRSRSYSGSSSKSGSRSGRSDSSASRGRRLPNRSQDIPRGNMRGFSDGQRGNLVNRNAPRNQSYRSRTGSSSSSRSPAAVRSRNDTSSALDQTTQKPASYSHGRGNASPLNYSNPRRNQQTTDPINASMDYSSFSNAPAPDVGEGSSLVSGLIQLKRRNQPESRDIHPPRRKRQASFGSSSSSVSGGSPRGNRDKPMTSERQRSGLKRTSLSPPFSAAQHNYKSNITGLSPNRANVVDNTDIPKRKRPKRVTRSPDSLSPPVIRGAYVNSSKLETASQKKTDVPAVDPPVVSRQSRRDNVGDTTHIRDVSRSPEAHRSTKHMSPNDRSRWQPKQNDPDWPRSSKKVSGKSQERINTPLNGDSSSSEDGRKPSKRRKQKTKNGDAEICSNTAPKALTENHVSIMDSDPPLDLVRTRKEVLAEDYKRDCEGFTTVVRALISKDADLENRLMPILKEILHERGQRCIEELRTFLADHKAESDGKNEVQVL